MFLYKMSGYYLFYDCIQAGDMVICCTLLSFFGNGKRTAAKNNSQTVVSAANGPVLERSSITRDRVTLMEISMIQSNTRS